MDRPQSKQVLLIVDADPENIKHLKTMLTPDYTIKVTAESLLGNYSGDGNPKTGMATIEDNR